MNIEYFGSARIFQALNNWLYVSLPMLAVVAFITVTFLAGAAWISHGADAAHTERALGAKITPEPAGSRGATQESGAAGRVNLTVLTVPVSHSQGAAVSQAPAELEAPIELKRAATPGLPA